MSKRRFALFLFIIGFVFAIGCSKVESPTTTAANVDKKQRVIVVVTDKASKMPVKDAKIHIVGEEETYNTDNMGKTNEFEILLKSDYFNDGTEEITTKISCGFVSLVVKAQGYSSHLEADYSVFPGDSISIIKVEVQKGKEYSIKANAPEIMYIEDLVKEYEKIENKEINKNDALKYLVKIIDDKNRPIEGVKIVIPEGRIVNLSNKNGEVDLLIPNMFLNNMDHKINKGYGEFTILAYKEGFAQKAVFKIHISKNEKENKITLVMKKTSKPLMEYSVVKPSKEWAKDLIDSIK